MAVYLAELLDFCCLCEFTMTFALSLLLRCMCMPGAFGIVKNNHTPKNQQPTQQQSVSIDQPRTSGRTSFCCKRFLGKSDPNYAYQMDANGKFNGD